MPEIQKVHVLAKRITQIDQVFDFQFVNSYQIPSRVQELFPFEIHCLRPMKNNISRCIFAHCFVPLWSCSLYEL